MGDAIREDARLPGPRAGDDEERPLGREDGLALRLVEVGEIGLGRRDAHRPTLDDGVAVAYQRTVSSTWAGIFGPDWTMLTHETRHVYVPFGSGSYAALQ